MIPTPFATFLDAVDAGDDDAAESAVFCLGLSDEPVLIALAGDEESADRRWWAVRALAEHGGPAALPAIVAALQQPDASTRAAAALAVGHLGARIQQGIGPALPALARLLADDDGFVRQAAVDGFALCGECAIPTLTEVLLQGQHEGARTRAASALRHLHSLAAAPALFRCLNDPNHLVRTFAYEALDELGLLETMLLQP